MAERKTVIRLPHIACEVTAQGVAAARAEGKTGTIEAMHSRALAAGVLTPALTTQNVQDAHALSDAIEQALLQRGRARPGGDRGAAGFGRARDPAGFRFPSRAAAGGRCRGSLPAAQVAAVRYRKGGAELRRAEDSAGLARGGRRLCCTACWRSTSRPSAPPVARRAWCCLPAWERWARWTKSDPPCC